MENGAKPLWKFAWRYSIRARTSANSLWSIRCRVHIDFYVRETDCRIRLNFPLLRAKNALAKKGLRYGKNRDAKSYTGYPFLVTSTQRRHRAYGCAACHHGIYRPVSIGIDPDQQLQHRHDCRAAGIWIESLARG